MNSCEGIQLTRESPRRSFFTLFVDSIELLQASECESESDFSATLARSSIINSLILPEVAANSLVDSLDLKPAIYREIDKMSVLGKMDLFLWSTFRNRSIDRGRSVVQKYQELKQLRDAFVHPKKHKLSWTQTSDDEETAGCELSQQLRLAKLSLFWDADTARLVMQGTHDYLNYFFKDCCRFSKTKAASILFSEENVPNNDAVVIPFLSTSARRLLKNWQVNIAYMKLGWL